MVRWVNDFFIRKADLLLRVLDSMWKSAPQEAELVSRLFEIHGISRGSKILELGCGNGRIAINLARLGYRVTGVDISPMLIEDAKRKAREYNVDVRFVVGDARKVDDLLKGKSFDAILFYWTTIIGYYDERTDLEVLRRCRKLIDPTGVLFILNHVNRDYEVLLSGLYGKMRIVEETIDMTILEEIDLDLTSSRINSTWRFYRKNGEDLIFIGESSCSVRLYSLHELISIAERAGWILEKAYSSLRTLEELTKPTLTRSYHLVLRPR